MALPLWWFIGTHIVNVPVTEALKIPIESVTAEEYKATNKYNF